jgi:ABC-type Fe3+ transport system permease subunit
MEHQERQSMQASWFGFFFAVLFALGIVAVGILISFFLLRYAVRGNMAR